MKLHKSILSTLAVLVVLASCYRLIPNRPLGFAPQIAIALFAGAVIRTRVYAFALPLVSMFISDLLFESLYLFGLSPYQGFYEGQWLNYILLTSLTLVGGYARSLHTLRIFAGAMLAPSIYFLLSNLAVWLGGGGYGHPKTIEGLMMTYIDGIPFYQGSLYATIVFCAVLFGGYRLMRPANKTAVS
jgi:hypothetical protein